MSNNSTPLPEHTILVAVTVLAENREEAEKSLHTLLPSTGDSVTAWWVAEDDRQDRSDCDSAVFVPKGAQRMYRSVVAEQERAAAENLRRVQKMLGDF